MVIACCFGLWCATAPATLCPPDWSPYVAEAHARYEARVLTRGAVRVDRYLRRVYARELRKRTVVRPRVVLRRAG